MKLTKLFIPVVLMLLASPLFAQDAAVTDEELQKYAVAMDSVEELKANLIETISEMVKNNEKITAARYNDLSRFIDDEAKLKELNATEEEVAAIKEIIAKKDEESAKINAAFQSLAKDYVGAAVYNKVRKALAADAELKSKYDAMLAELAKDNS